MWFVILWFVMWLKTGSAPALASLSATSVKDRRLSGPAALYRCTFSSSMQRHSADLVRRDRTTHSLCSRFADVLSLECTRHELLHPVKPDHGLLCNTRSSATTSSGPSPLAAATLATAAASFDVTQTVTAGSSPMLGSSPLWQLSFAADETEPLVASYKTPGDCPSNLLLAPITATSRQPPKHAQQKVGFSGKVILLVVCDSFVFGTHTVYSVSQKNPPWGFLTFIPKQLGIFSPNFTRLLYVSIYARLRFLFNHL